VAFTQNVLLAVDFGTFFGGSSWHIASGYKSALSLILLVAVLLIWPKGIFGSRD
jgi:branched-subunit amino acid ABC-type transport system permease component